MRKWFYRWTKPYGGSDWNHNEIFFLKRNEIDKMAFFSLLLDINNIILSVWLELDKWDGLQYSSLLECISWKKNYKNLPQHITIFQASINTERWLTYLRMRVCVKRGKYAFLFEFNFNLLFCGCSGALKTHHSSKHVFTVRYLIALCYLYMEMVKFSSSTHTQASYNWLQTHNMWHKFSKILFIQLVLPQR